MHSYTIKIENLNDKEIKVQATFIQEEGDDMPLTTRMFLSKNTIMELIKILESIDPGKMEGGKVLTLKGPKDDIGVTIEGSADFALLSIVNDHTKEDGTNDPYGILDIPFIDGGILNRKYVTQLTDELIKFAR